MPSGAGSRIVRALKWGAGAVVGVVGLLVAGVMLVLCFQIAVAPPTEKLSKLGGIAIAYAFAFLAVVVGIACIRLIVPQLRTRDGGILDNWSFRVLATIYGLVLIAGALLDPQAATVRVAMVAFGLLVIAALRSTFRWRKGTHSRDPDPDR